MNEGRLNSKKKSDKFYKSRKNKVIDGICAGLADYLGVDVMIVRIIWLLSIFLNGIGFIAYLIAMILVPANPAHAGVQPDAKKKKESSVYWGAILIVIGFFLLSGKLFRQISWDFPFHFQWFQAWHIPWHLIWPLGLITLGILYIIYVYRQPGAKQKESVSAEDKTKIYRSKQNKMLFGVCGGLARYWNTDPTLIRILAVILTLATHIFVGMAGYILLVFIIPEESSKK